MSKIKEMSKYLEIATSANGLVGIKEDGKFHIIQKTDNPKDYTKFADENDILDYISENLFGTKSKYSSEDLKFILNFLTKHVEKNDYNNDEKKIINKEIKSLLKLLTPATEKPKEKKLDKNGKEIKPGRPPKNKDIESNNKNTPTALNKTI